MAEEELEEAERAALREAIGRGAIGVVFQPIVSLRTGRATRLEAACCWTSPSGRDVSAERIVDAARQEALLPRLTLIVARAVASHLRPWREARPELTAHLNLSLLTLLSDSFQDELLRAFAVEDCDPTALGVEITENTLHSAPAAAAKALARLRARGVRILIDQFGTGYSSIGQLLELPVDALKIDGRFVARMTSDHRHETVVRASVGLAHDLGIEAVAVGVEDRDTWELLRALGCDAAQGDHVAVPMAAEDVVEWLASWEAGLSFLGRSAIGRELVTPRAEGRADVLVVEDDPTIAEMIREVLDREGFHVVIAADGGEALREVERQVPSLVLLDIQLPTLSGPGFAKALRERNVNVPIVVMTAGSSAERWAREIQAAAFLSKPFELEGLIAIADRYAKGRRPLH